MKCSIECSALVSQFDRYQLMKNRISVYRLLLTPMQVQSGSRDKIRGGLQINKHLGSTSQLWLTSPCYSYVVCIALLMCIYT